MTRESTLATLGILIALSPFLGLPYAVLMWVVPALGLVVAVLAYSAKFPLRGRSDAHEGDGA